MFKKGKNSFIHWFFAFSFAIISFLFFLSFTKQSINSTDDGLLQTSRIFIYPVGDDRNIKRWIDVNDPSLAILPNNEYGYSSIINSDFIYPSFDKSLGEDLDLLTLNIFNVSKDAMFFLTADTVSVMDILLPFRFPLPEIPKKAMISFKKSAYPIVVGKYTDMDISLNFQDDIKEINAILQKNNFIKPTIVKIEIPDNLDLIPNCEIISSSGVTELDKIAENKIITSDVSKKVKTSLLGQTIFIEIYWKNSLGALDKNDTDYL